MKYEQSIILNVLCHKLNIHFSSRLLKFYDKLGLSLIKLILD